MTRSSVIACHDRLLRAEALVGKLWRMLQLAPEKQYLVEAYEKARNRCFAARQALCEAIDPPMASLTDHVGTRFDFSPDEADCDFDAASTASNVVCFATALAARAESSSRDDRQVGYRDVG